LRSSGYFFDDDYSYLDLVSRDPREQPEVNDCAEDDWAETNWISKKENDMFPQKEGQQWQTNGWDDNSVDGPTEFRFNGISEKDLTKGFYKREG
jgi:hypothetical protein